MSIKLRATPDMDTRDCEYVNAGIAELVAALRDCASVLEQSAENNRADAKALHYSVKGRALLHSADLQESFAKRARAVLTGVQS